MEKRKSVGYLKLPPEIHALIIQLAQAENRKITDEVIALIKLGLSAQESQKAGERDLRDMITQLQDRVASLERGPPRVKRRSRA